MNKLIDMKRKIKEMEQPVEIKSSSKESYPYGLRVSLEKEELKKLGIKLTDYNVGDKVDLLSNATITSISSNESEGHESNRIGFELREMNLKSKED